jgi:hypothetical protein
LNFSYTLNATSIHQKSAYSNDGTTIFERFKARSLDISRAKKFTI